MSINVGFIGYGRHAKRLRALLERYPEVLVRKVFHPSKKLSESGATNSLFDLLELDAIFIVSPNSTHCRYLLQLLDEGYNGYIFCEKPLAVNKKEVTLLRARILKSTRLFVNFNYRYSRFVAMAERAVVTQAIGEPIAFYVNNTQGLAFKKEYRNSWRSDAAAHPLGVTETKTVHYLDMALRLFGAPIQVNLSGRNIAGTGTAIDTSKLDLLFQDGQWGTVIASYAGSFSMHLCFTGTNGELNYLDDSITLYSPRSTFDRQGNFIRPSTLEKYEYDGNGISMGEESLQRALDVFIDHCKSRSPIPRIEHENSMLVSSIMTDLLDKCQSQPELNEQGVVNVELRY